MVIKGVEEMADKEHFTDKEQRKHFIDLYYHNPHRGFCKYFTSILSEDPTRGALQRVEKIVLKLSEYVNPALVIMVIGDLINMKSEEDWKVAKWEAIRWNNGRMLQLCYDVMSLKWMLITGAFYLIGAVFYSARIPERFFPGSFDIWGHSHQIFHFLVVFASLSYYYGIIQAMSYWHENNHECQIDI
ncbi:36_t:CDS:2, partial [Scutellospora calospora]